MIGAPRVTPFAVSPSLSQSNNIVKNETREAF